jgi:hypothetical protein
MSSMDATLFVLALSLFVVDGAAAQNIVNTPSTLPVAVATAPAATDTLAPDARLRMSPRVVDRPSPTLWMFYGMTAVVQGYDVASTFRALDAGAVEANPVLSWATPSRPGFVALKASIAAGAIYSAHKLAHRHKATAIIMLVAINSASAAVVMHNYELARQIQR